MAAGPTHLTKQLRSVPRDTKNRSGLLTHVTLLGPIRDVIKTEASPERFLLWKLEFLEFLNPVKTCDYSNIAYNVRVRYKKCKELLMLQTPVVEQTGATVAFYTCIREVLLSNFGWNTRYPDKFLVVFVSPSRQMPG
jgi:hypothetical protein